MLEIEAKYAVADFASIEDKLRSWNARFVEVRRDADNYFNAPDRDFSKTDEALRLRRIGERNVLTYKGPKIDRETKTRKEIEVPMADGDSVANDLGQMLVELGYKPVAIVGKRRQVYELVRDGYLVHFCLDEVDQVGAYVEVEIVARDDDFEAPKALLLRIAGELGLTAAERKSYLQLLLERTIGIH